MDETIRLLKAFQFVVRFFFFVSRNVSLHLLQEEHGEVCPLGWTEGAKTIKPDPKGSMDYFSTVDDAATNGHANGSAKKRLRTN